MVSFSITKLTILFAYGVRSIAGLTCEVPGGTSDDAPAIKAALATCNNGGTVSDKLKKILLFLKHKIGCS